MVKIFSSSYSTQNNTWTKKFNYLFEILKDQNNHFVGMIFKK